MDHVRYSMAGDWIPWSCGLEQKAEVIEMAAILEMPRLHVAGMLMSIWTWAGYQTENGRIYGVSPSTIDELCGVPGCADSMQKVGWLVHETRTKRGSIRFPNWNDWNSNSAKARILDTKRKRKTEPKSVRKNSGSEPEKNRTTGPDRTGQNNIPVRRENSEGETGPDRMSLQTLMVRLVDAFGWTRDQTEAQRKTVRAQAKRVLEIIPEHVDEVLAIAAEKSAAPDVDSPVRCWWSACKKRWTELEKA